MRIRKTPVAVAASIALLSLAGTVQAQQATSDQDASKKDAQLEQVVVTGIRASLQTAVNIKRNASAIVDAVSAEDIGKLPDSDVGESLGRIPGVSVDREFGQGALVSIRGSDPQMTYTTLNGQTVASTGWYDQQSIDRSFNYSLLPSELIGGMDVYKTSQADLTEGGIGGTVIVKTRKPLDMAANTAFFSAKAAKGTISTEPDTDVSGLYSWKDSQKKFGFLVAGAIESGQYIRRGVESDTRWSQDVEPTTFVQERKRQAVNIDLQARPAANMGFDLAYMSLQLGGDNSNTSQYIFQSPSAYNSCTANNAAGVCVHSVTTAANASDEFVQTWARTAKMTSDSLVLNGDYKIDAFKLNGVLGSTWATGGTSETTNYAYYGGNLPTWTGTIDATGKMISVNPSSNQSYTTANLPATIDPSGSWATTKGPNADKENFAQLDATTDLDWGFISAFKAGLRAADHTFTKNTIRANFLPTASQIAAPTPSLYSGTIVMGEGPTWTAPKPNIGAMMANTNANITSWTLERAGFGQLEEKNTSLYGMFDFDKDQLRGNAGLRYIHTSVTGSGYKFDGSPLAAGDIAQNQGWSNTIVTQTASYNDILPSLNLAYNLQKDLILRFAAAKAITRPNYDNMFLLQEAGFADNVADQTMTFGNVALKPMSSKQMDLGLEYYYGRGNLISVDYFHKSIDNFITTVTQVNQQLGLVNPNIPGLDSWTVNHYVNAGGGKIDGLETQINHAFDNGFGVIANYTYVDATAPASSYQDQINMFTQSSKHNVNLVGYFENSEYSARLAYNWRSKYMMRETGWYGNRMHDDYGTLDLSLGYTVSKNVRLTFDATNLLKENNIQYGAAATTTTVKVPLQVGYPAWSFMGETIYRLGLNAKF